MIFMEDEDKEPKKVVYFPGNGRAQEAPKEGSEIRHAAEFHSCSYCRGEIILVDGQDSKKNIHYMNVEDGVCVCKDCIKKYESGEKPRWDWNGKMLP